MEPDRYPKRILLCVTGLSPQIITETLYALTVTQRPGFIPTEIHLLTTAEGAQRAALTLLEPQPGYFFRLCEDAGLDRDAIRFGANTIHVLTGPDGSPLGDIRSPADNEAAANAITDRVRQLTADPQSAVHASIAGGRKTMGFYLGYALSLFGRPQDQLSHVLVSAPFESHQDFFFPPHTPRVLYTPPPNSIPIHTKDARITLADIPFVRLRDELPDHLLQRTASFSDTVRATQQRLGPPELVLDPARLTASCGGTAVALSRVNFAFLAWFARHAATTVNPGVCRGDVSPRETAAYLAEYRALCDGLSGEYERVEQALGQAMDEDYFDSRKAMLHKQLRKALGSAGAKPYLIESDRRRPRSRYALGLRGEQIRFV